MCVRCREQQCAECDAEETAEITFEYTVKKKSKNKFLNYRRDCCRKNNNQNSLIDRARSAEKLDDVLLARAASENPLGNDIGQQDQWISEKQQGRSSAQGSDKTDPEETA